MFSLETDIWEIAARAADRTILLPGDIPLFFRRIPAAGKTFMMGARGAGLAREEPQHRVGFVHDFYLGSFVVTQEQWRSVAERSDALRENAVPSFSNGPRRPVERVSWDEATVWCEGLTKLPEFPRDLIARLPTEAEWEYACRASNETDYYKGDGEAALAEVGWYGGNLGGETHAVDEAVGGRGEEHPWGLYGMHGNVDQWCRDVYREHAYRARVDGADNPEERLRKGEETDSDRRVRVVRGGSWGGVPGECRSAYRGGGFPDFGGRSLGFRVCLAPGPAELQQQSTETEKAQAKPGVGGAAGRGSKK